MLYRDDVYPHRSTTNSEFVENGQCVLYQWLSDFIFQVKNEFKMKKRCYVLLWVDVMVRLVHQREHCLQRWAQSSSGVEEVPPFIETLTKYSEHHWWNKPSDSLLQWKQKHHSVKYTQIYSITDIQNLK